MTMTATTTLDDLDFADDIDHHQDMQEKTDDMVTAVQSLKLKGSIKKTKGMEMNARVKDSIKLNENEIEEINDFTYLGFMISNTEDGEVESRARVAKASHTFASLGSTWKAGNTL
jgi:hypothetical protein